MLDGTRVGQNLFQEFGSARTDQDGLDAAADAIVQVPNLVGVLDSL